MRCGMPLGRMKFPERRFSCTIWRTLKEGVQIMAQHPRLVTMPRRGERAGPAQWCMGFQGYPNAGRYGL